MSLADTAILLVDWLDEGWTTPRLPGSRSLLPVLGMPLLQRSVEALVRQGVRHLHLLLGEHPTAVREFLGQGERWGLSLKCHYRQDDQSLAHNLKPLNLDAQALYWLACPERLPELNPASAGCERELHLCTAQQGAERWCGWGCYSGARLAALSQARRFDEVATLLEGGLAPMPPAFCTVVNTLDVATDAALLHSNLLALASPGVDPATQAWLGRGAVVDAKAVLQGPVYVGSEVRIAAGARVGPHAVIGHGAVIDRDALLRDCVVLPDTYVGQGLEIDHTVAGPTVLSNLRLGVVLRHLDTTLLASVQRGWHKPSSHPWPARALQAALLPLWLLARLALRRQGLAEPEPSQMLVPTPGKRGGQPLPLADPGTWLHQPGPHRWLQHFLHSFYPGLRAVSDGRLQLFGLEPRTLQQIAHLPAHWRTLYQHRPCGLLSEATLLDDAGSQSLARFTSDAYSSGEQSRRQRAGLLLRYLDRVWHDTLHAVLHPARTGLTSP